MGATAVDIRNQFFAESATLTIISGAVGLLVGVGLCTVMGLLPLPDFVPRPIISPLAIAASLATLGIITIAAGMYPAQRAANLSPIECLRQE
jgi:putative ABC transport system permease protein